MASRKIKMHKRKYTTTNYNVIHTNTFVHISMIGKAGVEVGVSIFFLFKYKKGDSVNRE